MEYQKYQKLVEDFVYHITKIKKLSENTIKNYQYDLSQFDNFINGSDITQELVNEYKDHLDKISIMKGEKQKGKKGILKSTANRRLLSLDYFFKWAKSDLTASKIEVHESYTDVEALDLKDYLSMTTQAKRNKDYRASMVLKVLANTGLRVSELLSLKRDDFTSLLKIAVPDYMTVNVKGKGSKWRPVIINQEALKSIKQYLRFGEYLDRTQTYNKLFVGYKGEMTRAGVFAILKKLATEIGENDPKCPQVTGRTERTIKKQEAIKEAWLKTNYTNKIYPHSMRHLTAKCLQDLGIDVDTIAQILGHKAEKVTNIYTRRSKEEMASILNDLGEYLKTGKKPGKALENMTKEELLKLLLEKK